MREGDLERQRIIDGVRNASATTSDHDEQMRAEEQAEWSLLSALVGGLTVVLAINTFFSVVPG